MASTKKRPDTAMQLDPGWMYRLRITLLDIEPSIWRAVLVPETITLSKLHSVIQAAMGWTNSHLHEFVIAGRRYSDYLEEQWEPDEILDERGVVLEAALGPSARTFDYVYDFATTGITRSCSKSVSRLCAARPPPCAAWRASVPVHQKTWRGSRLRGVPPGACRSPASRARGTASMVWRLVRFRALRPQTDRCTAETDQCLTVKTALTGRLRFT